MQIDDLARHYASLTDGELLHLADFADDLTPQAAMALRDEISRRRIEQPKPAPVTEQTSRWGNLLTQPQPLAGDKLLEEPYSPHLPPSIERIDELSRTYAFKTDDELLALTADSLSLTHEGSLALRDELARRHLQPAPPTTEPAETPAPWEDLAAALGYSPPKLGGTNAMLLAALRLQQEHFWLFFSIMMPATLLIWGEFSFTSFSIREMLLPVYRSGGPHSLQHLPQLASGAVLRFVGFLAVWTTSGTAYAAICSAVRKLRIAQIPPWWQCFAELRQRPRAFLWLCCVLFLIVAALCAFAEVIVFAALYFFGVRWASSGQWSILWSYIPVAVGGLIFSPLALAIPAFILGEQDVTSSLRRSYALTSGQWWPLTVLVLKTLLGGYIASRIVFIVADFLLGGQPVSLSTYYFITLASTVPVAAFEITIFLMLVIFYEQRLAPTEG